MDMKYKIVISIFIIVALFYFAQFVVSYMTSFKRRESFTEYFDDIEHYEEPEQKKSKPVSKFTDSKPVSKFADSKPNQPTTTQEAPSKSEDMQKLRLFILDQLDDVSDKKQKTNLIEYLFSEPIIKTLIEMSEDKRKEFIKTTKDNMAQPAREEPKSNFIPDIKDYFDNNTQNVNNQISSRLDSVLSNLDSMKDGLSDIKNLIVNKGPKEPYIPSLPSLPIAATETKLPKITENFVDGYENIRSWGAKY